MRISIRDGKVRLYDRKTEIWLSIVRVKRKGQVTIPLELRSGLGIKGGTLLEAKQQRGAIVMRPALRLKAGKVVGEKEYKRLIHELDELRTNAGN